MKKVESQFIKLTFWKQFDIIIITGQYPGYNIAGSVVGRLGSSP